MMNYIYKTTLVISFLLVSLACKTAKQADVEKDTEIQWLSYDEAVKKSAKKPKKIFIDVYTGWCGWCKAMDKKVFTDPAIVKAINKYYYPVKLNAESNKSVAYKGTVITEREFASSVLKASGYPTTVYLDSKENILQPIPGYIEVDILEKILHYYGADHYKNTEWEIFQARFKKE